MNHGSSSSHSVSSTYSISQSAHGKNLLANRIIHEGELVLIFEGEEQSEPSMYTLQIDEKRHLLSTGGPQYLCHSCSPNLYIDWKHSSPYFKAYRTISKNEELTFHYCTTEWEMNSPFKCDCKSEHCLKEIKGYKYCTEEWKRDHRSQISPYLQKQEKM